VDSAVSKSATLIPTARDYGNWLNRFAWFTAFATLLLICSGGMVTSKNVGLAVPDWPTTFGYNMFLFPVSKWIGGVFFEHTHRLIASTVGLLTIILALWLYGTRARPFMRWFGIALVTYGLGAQFGFGDPSGVGIGWSEIGAVLFGASFFWPRAPAVARPLRLCGLIAVGSVALQGILGGLRVTMLKDQIGIFHACIAQAFFGLIVLIALMTTDFWRMAPANLTGLTGQVSRQRIAHLKTIVIATTIAIYIQLALGATMRHQHRDLAILDFPTANGAWIPDTSAQALAKINAWRDMRGFSDVSAFQIWLQMTHRFVALLIAIGVIVFAVQVWRDAREITALKRLSILWVGLVSVQLTLGAWTIWSNKAADIATAHVAVGAVMLSFGVSVWVTCHRLVRAVPGGGALPLLSQEHARA
jgi:cytochrome c oxidase assembly protein subunit 15